jgi:hypothetical protein
MVKLKIPTTPFVSEVGEEEEKEDEDEESDIDEYDSSFKIESLEEEED